MAATSPLGLRYPPATGVTPDVPRDLGYLAADVQAALGSVAAGLQQGAVDAGSYEVTQASGGASMDIDVASHTGSGAFVQDDGIARGALFYVAPTTLKTTVTAGTAHGTHPRVDRIVVSLAGVVSVVAGTATSGATLDNLTGAAAVPVDSLLLADVLIPTSDTTLSNSQIRDRRTWARGAYYTAVITAGSYTVSGGSPTIIDATRLSKRVECSGVPIRIRLNMTVEFFGTDELALRLYQDGVEVNARGISVTAAAKVQPCIEFTFTPAAGSHVFAWYADETGTNPVLIAETFGPMVFEVEELVRQNTANNSTTSG